MARVYDNDMIQCMSCESNVHLGCDALAREFQAAKGEKADSQEHEKVSLFTYVYSSSLRVI